MKHTRWNAVQDWIAGIPWQLRMARARARQSYTFHRFNYQRRRRMAREYARERRQRGQL